MLQAIRDRAQTWISWIIVSFIVLVFALWGIQEYVGGGPTINAAIVNDAEIDVNEYRQTYLNYREQTRQRLLKMFGNQPNNPFMEQLMDETRMKKEVMDGLISHYLVVQNARDAGYRMSEAQLNAYIRDIPSFQTAGQFDQEAFERNLRYQGLSAQGFKQRLQRDLMVQQVTSGIQGSDFDLPNEADALLKIKNQERDIGYMILKAADHQEGIEIEDAVLQEYYDGNHDKFMNPEKLSIEYLSMSRAEIATGISIDDESIKAYYEENAASYSEVDDSDLIARANAALERVRAGEDFAAVAQEVSSDPGSASQGGDLGFFGRNVMAKEFEEMTYNLKEGEVSDPVKTTFGYHIIKLTGIKDEERRASHILISRPAGEKPKYLVPNLDKVRAKVVQDYKNEQAERQFSDQYDLLNNLTYENPNTLDIAAGELGLKVQLSPMFTRLGGPGIAANRRISEAAFSDEVLGQRSNSEPLELDDGSVVVLRVKEHQPEAVKPFEEVKEQVKTRLLTDKSREAAQALGEKLVAEINRENAVDLAKQNKSEWTQSGFVARQGSKADAAVVGEAFKLPKPAEGGELFQGVKLSSGDYAIIGLFGVRDGDPAKAEQKDKDPLIQQLRQARTSSESAAFREDLKAKAEIHIFETEI